MWLEESLDQLADIKMGQSPDSSSYNDKGYGVAFLQGCAEFGDLYPTANVYCSSPGKIASESSVLISVRAPVGDLNLADKEYCIGRGLAAISGKKVPSKYLYYSIDLNKSYLARLAQGSTFDAVGSKELKNHQVFYPSNTNERQRLIEILETADSAIEKTQALIAKYENIKQGMMQDLFSRGVDENGQLRLSYEDAPHLYQETELGWIPKDWTIKTVGQVFEIQLGKMLSQKSKSGKFEAYYLGNKNVQWGYFDLSKVETMDFQSSERQKFILKKGDILVTEGGEVGRTAIWNNELGECYYQKALHRLRPNSTEVVPEYFSHFMFLSNLTGAFTDFTSQTSIAHLTQEKLSKFPIKLPPKNEQLMLAKVLGRHDDLILLENEKLAKLKKIKAGLMQDLLTGKVRVAEDTNERKEAVA